MRNILNCDSDQDNLVIFSTFKSNFYDIIWGGVRSNFWQLSPKFTKFPKVAKSCQKLPKIIKFGNKILLKTVAIWLLIITSKAPLSVLEVIKSDKKSNIKLFAPVHV